MKNIRILFKFQVLIQKILLFKIYTWMSQQVAANPSFLSEASAGKTYENRDIRYVVFNSPNPNARNIWLDCGIHGKNKSENSLVI